MNQLQATLPARGGPAAFSATARIDTPGHAVGTSPQVYAKVAGVIWLMVAMLAPFGEFFVRQGLIVPGNVAATAEKIVASQLLFRAGFATDLVVFVIEVALAAVLYVLFRPVSRTLALVMAFARLAMVTILGLNLLNMFTALQLLTSPEYATAFEKGTAPGIGLCLPERSALRLRARDGVLWPASWCAWVPGLPVAVPAPDPGHPDGRFSARLPG